jgi:hypothetical protein
MACQILVSNNSGLPKASIVTVVDGDHFWSSTESMQAFLESGGLFENWSRVFSIVKVTDKTVDELNFLNDRNINMLPTWSFTEPLQSSDDWNSLYLNGEVERTWAEISRYLVER